MSSRNQKNSWWAKVVFDEFTSHFIGMSREEIADDITESMKKVLSRNSEGNSFGAFMVRIAEERIEKNREARVKPSSDNSASNAKKPNQLIYGRFENVYLTQDQYNELIADMGNVNEFRDMLENLSAKLEDGSVESDNHFATLTSWIQYRKDKEQKQAEQPRYMTSVEKTLMAREIALKEIHEKYGNK